MSIVAEVSTRRHEFDVEDVEYHRAASGPILARIYRPRGTGPFAAMVDVHGGGWTSGDRKQNETMSSALAARGVVVAALDFRMPPEAIFPVPITDVNLGIRWFKANAARFGTTADRVGGLGSSSGAHQLLVSALRPTDPRYAAIPGPAGVTAELRFVVACWPVADPLVRFHMAQERSIKMLVDAHRAYWPDEAAMADGNPQRILERGEALSRPPMLILQGTNDENVTADMADRFAAAYRAAGGQVEVEKYDGEPHTFITKNPTGENSVKGLKRIGDFVLRQAGG